MNKTECLVYRTEDELTIAYRVLMVRGCKGSGVRLFLTDFLSSGDSYQFFCVIDNKIWFDRPHNIAENDELFCIPTDTVINDELKLLIDLGHNPFTERFKN